MGANVDERIVQMKFDNAQFEKGIATSMSSLEKFHNSLHSKEGTKGLQEVASGVEKITSVSTGLIAKVTAISRVTNEAITVAKNFVKTLTIDPIKTGLNEYELKMGSVQTILMGTGESLDVVMDKLEELNRYADRTVYSFQDMTSNIGKFTNAGVKLDAATKAIQGVSNLAAVSGANAVEASRAMYNISQALGTGYMQLIDWKSIENANMATMEFKQTLIDTAIEMGVLSEADKVTAENFRETLKDKWLTNEVLLRTLVKYTDETTELGKKAYAAATEIKTATQLFDVMKESVQSGWAITWENIIGNFDEAKELFTGIGKMFDIFASKSADSRNSVLADWKELGGRQAIITSLYNTFANLLILIKPFKEAFRDVFPATTGRTLADLSQKLRDFTSHVWISKDAAEGLKNVLVILLTPVKLLCNAFKMAASVIGTVASIGWYMAQVFLSMFKNVDSFGTIMQKVLGDERYTRILTAWNKLLANFQNGVINLIKGVAGLVSIISNLSVVKNIRKEASEFMNSGVDKFLDNLISAFEKLANFDFTFPSIDISTLNKYKSFGNTLDFLRKKYDELKLSIRSLFSSARKNESLLGTLKANFEGVTQKIKEFVSRITPGKILLVGYGLALTLFITKLSKLTETITGLIGSISGITSGISKAIDAFVFDKKAASIIKIAASFGMLAASLVALTLVDTKKLIAAGVALGLLGTGLIVFSKIFGKITNISDIPKVLASFVGLSVSIWMLVASLNALNKITFKDDIWKNLGVLATTLAGFAAIAIVLSKLAPKMSGGSLFLVAFAFSVDKLVIALEKLQGLSISSGEATVKQMISLLALIGGFVVIAGKMKITSAAGILLLAGSIDLIITAFNKISANIDLSGLDTVFSNVKSAIITIKNFVLSSSIQDLQKLGGTAIVAAAGIVALSGSLYFILSGINMLSKGIVKVAIAIGIVIASFKLLEKVDPKTIESGVKVLKQIFIGFSGLTAVLGLFSAGFGSSSGEVKGTGGMLKSLDGLLKGTQKVVQLGKAASKIGTAMIKVSVAIGVLVGVMKLMEHLDPDKMKQNLVAIEILMTTFGVMIALTAFAKKSGPIIALAAVIGTLVSALALFTLIPSKELMISAVAIGVALIALGQMFNGLATGIDFRTALSAVISMVGIVLSIRVLMEGLKAMEDYDWNNGLKAAAGLSLLAVAFAGAVKILSTIKNFNELGSSMISFIGVTATMLAATVILGNFAQQFYSIDWASLISGSVSIGILAIGFAKAAEILSGADFGSFSAMGTALTTFAGIAGSMTIVASLLGVLAKGFFSIDWSSMIAGSVSLGIMANSFAFAASLLSSAKFDSFEKMGTALGAFSGVALATSIAVNILAPAFMKMATIPWNTLITAGAAVSTMSIGMATATGILAMFANTMEKHIVGMVTGAGVMIAVAAACRVLSPALQMLAGIKMGSMLTAMVGLAGTLGILGGAAYIFGKAMGSMLKGTVILLALSAVLKLLVPSLQQLATIKFMDAIQGIGALTVALVALGACAGILGMFIPQILLGTVAIAGFGLALKLFVPQLQQLATIKFMDAIQGIGALAIALVALGACTGIMGMFIPQILLGTVAIAGFGLALKLFVPQLQQLATISFADALQGIGALTIALVALGACTGIMGSLFPLMSSGTIILIGLGVAVNILATGLKTGASAVQKFATAMNIMLPTLTALGSMNLTGIAGGLGLVALSVAALSVSSLLLIPAAVAVGTFSAALGLLSLALYALNSVLESADMLSNLFNAGVDIAGKLLNGIQSTIDGVNGIVEIAKNAVQGFINGVIAEIDNIWDAGVVIANSFMDGLCSVAGLDEHSPSIAMSTKGVYAVVGFIGGTESQNKAVKAAGVGTANAYKSGVNSGLKSVEAQGAALAKSVANAEKKTGQKEMPKAAKAGMDKQIEMMEKYHPKFESEGGAEAKAAADGFTDETKTTIPAVGASAGRELITSMADGLKEKFPFMGKTIDSAVQYIESNFGEAIDNMDVSVLSRLIDDNGGLLGFASDFLGMDDTIGSVTDSLDGIFDGLSGGIDGVGDSASKASADIEDLSDKLAELRTNIMDSMDMFSKFDDTVDISIDDMFVNMQSQIEGVSKWSKDLANLTAMGFHESFVKELADKGLDGYKYVEALQDATAEQIFTYNQMYLEFSNSADAAMEYVKAALPKFAQYLSEKFGEPIEFIGHAATKAKDGTWSFCESLTGAETVLDSTSWALQKATEITEDATQAQEENTEAQLENAEAMQENADVQADNTDATEDNTQAQKDNTKEEDKNTTSKEDNTEAHDENTDSQDENTEAQKENTESQIENTEATEDATEATQEHTDAELEAAKAEQEQGDSASDAADDTSNLGDAMKFTVAQAVELVKRIAKVNSELSTMQESLKETIDDQINIFEVFDDGSEKISKGDLLKNMDSQLKGIVEWKNNLKSLFSQGISEDFYQYLMNLGQDGKQYVDALLSMTPDELKKADDYYTQLMTISDTASQEIVDKLRESGKYSVAGLIEGVKECIPEVYNAGMEAADAYNQGYQEQEQIHSPSVVQFQNGVYETQGLINGINSMLPAVRNVGRAMGYALTNNTNGFKSVANYDVFYRIGLQIDQGLINGIRDMTDRVAAQAAEMARAAYEAACAALGVHSPSKMFYEIGMYLDLGMANAMDDYSRVVEMSSRSVGEAALNSMRDSIAKLQAYALSDIEDPVIRPVLDLSEIQNGVKSANVLLSSGISASSKIAMEGNSVFNASRDSNTSTNNQTSNTTAGNSYNFVQNNYSPKALSRIDIYRQTKSQFAELKGVQ